MWGENCIVPTGRVIGEAENAGQYEDCSSELSQSQRHVIISVDALLCK